MHNQYKSLCICIMQVVLLVHNVSMDTCVCTLCIIILVCMFMYMYMDMCVCARVCMYIVCYTGSLVRVNVHGYLCMCHCMLYW